MWQAIDAGLAVRRLCGITRGVASERDAFRALGVAGLRLEYFPLHREVPALLIEDTVYLHDGLRPLETPFVVAHEVGHHMLQHGGGLFTPLRSSDMRLYRRRNECQAHLFAGAFCWGDPTDHDFDQRIAEAAEDGVPSEQFIWFFNAWMGGRGTTGGFHPVQTSQRWQPFNLSNGVETSELP